jgi:Ribbon-helix-helix protein, copG family
MGAVVPRYHYATLDTGVQPWHNGPVPRNNTPGDPVSAAVGNERAAAANRAMNLRLSERDAKELELVAEVEGLSVAAVIRQAIRSHLDGLAQDDEFKRRSRALLEEHKSILERFAS